MAYDRKRSYTMKYVEIRWSYTIIVYGGSIRCNTIVYDCRKRSFNTAIVNDVRLRSYCCRVFPFQAAESWNRSRIIRPVRSGPSIFQSGPVRSMSGRFKKCFRPVKTGQYFQAIYRWLKKVAPKNTRLRIFSQFFVSIDYCNNIS